MLSCYQPKYAVEQTVKLLEIWDPIDWGTDGTLISKWLWVTLMWHHHNAQHPWRKPRGWFNIKPSWQYTAILSHCGDKTVIWPSYLHNGFPIVVRGHLYSESGPWRTSAPTTTISLRNLLTQKQCVLLEQGEHVVGVTIFQNHNIMFHIWETSGQLSSRKTCQI